MFFPLKGFYRISSTFLNHINAGGERAKHAGVDFVPSNDPVIGTPLHAVEEGTLTNFYETVQGKRGLASFLVSNDELRRWGYTHMQKWTRAGGKIGAGQQFSTTGMSGWILPPDERGAHTHLSLEIRKTKNDKWVTVDPMPYFAGLPTGKNYELIRAEWLKSEPKCAANNIDKVPLSRVCKVTSGPIFDCGHNWQYVVFTDWQGWLPNDCLKATTRAITSGKSEDPCAPLREENEKLKAQLEEIRTIVNNSESRHKEEVKGLQATITRLEERVEAETQNGVELQGRVDDLEKINEMLRGQNNVKDEDAFTSEKMLEIIIDRGHQGLIITEGEKLANGNVKKDFVLMLRELIVKIRSVLSD